MAAVVVWLMNPANEEAYEKFVSLGITNVYPSRADVEPPGQWVKWLRSATRRCVLLGTSHSKWCTDPGFRGALEERLRNSVDVSILFLDPNRTAAKVRAIEEEGRDTIHQIKTAIRVLWKIRVDLPPELQRRLKLYVYEATPSMGVLWIDDRFMVASHILAGSMNVTSPCLLLEPGRYGSEHQNLYGTYARNVKSIEEKFSTEISEANVNEYIPQE